jgi:hypothetical protein
VAFYNIAELSENPVSQPINHSDFIQAHYRRLKDSQKSSA